MDFLLRQARRCSINLYITSMIILVVAILISFFPIRDYYLSLQPYKEFEEQKLMAGEYDQMWFRDFYYMKSDEYIDLGTEPYTIEVKIGKEMKEVVDDDDYLLIKSGEYWLPVTIHDNVRESVDRYQGKLAGINDREFEELKARAKKIGGEEFDTDKILDARLDTTVSSTLWTNFLFWIASVLYVIFLINIIKLIRRQINPYRSPVFSDLIIYGDIEEIEQSINSEMESQEFTVFEKVIITDSWFLSKRKYTVDIAPLSDIVWVYTKAEWKRWKGIIPIYKVTRLNVIIRNELHHEAVFRTKAKAEGIVDKLKEKLPWIIVGYSKGIKKPYDSDFESLVKKVDDQKSLIS